MRVSCVTADCEVTQQTPSQINNREALIKMLSQDNELTQATGTRDIIMTRNNYTSASDTEG